MEKTYTWKRIPQPDPVYLIDGRPVDGLEFLAEHERRAAETVGFARAILGEPWSEDPVKQVAEGARQIAEGLAAARVDFGPWGKSL